MAERTKATVSKTVESYLGFRGFKSHSLRAEARQSCRASWLRGIWLSFCPRAPLAAPLVADLPGIAWRETGSNPTLSAQPFQSPRCAGGRYRRPQAGGRGATTDPGGMAERTKATVLKTVEVIPPWVRIPLPPPQKPSISWASLLRGFERSCFLRDRPCAPPMSDTTWTPR